MFEMRAKIVAMGLIGGAILLPINAAQAEQVGHASWYALHSRTASGEIMKPGDLTAAHRSLPFGTRVLVENLSNGHSVVVRINDRGPFVAGRIIDVSKAAASSLGMLGSGTASVRVSAAGGASASKAAPKIAGLMRSAPQAVRVSAAGGASASKAAPKIAGLMRSAPQARLVAARASTRKTVAVASRELRRAPRRGVVLASADSPYSVFGRSTPGFMKD